MPNAVEPGTRLVERYRLEERLDGPAGTGRPTEGSGEATYWRATDELLDRPVAICLLGVANGAGERVLAAARRAAALTDARFLRVLDAAEVDGLVYVVTEWVNARSLPELVADGPLSPPEARALAVEITGALAAAHRTGLNHLSLRPEHVRRTQHGQVKLAGLAVDAAARDVAAADPAEAARRDTAGAGSVLYAAFTGRWPGPETTELPPAPRDGDAVCSPRQVRAGVPDDLDDVVCRALGIPGRHGTPPLTSVQDMSEALAAAHVTSRLSLPGAAAARRERPVTPPPDEARAIPEQRRGRPSGRLVVWVLAGVLLLAGGLLAGSQLLLGALDRATTAQGASDGPGSADPPESVGPLEVAEAGIFDPYGDGDEHSEQAPLAVDDDPATAWTTVEYYDPLPLIKDGVGLLLDLGERQHLTEVTVTVQGATDLEIRVANREGGQLADYRRVARAGAADGKAVLQVRDDVRARYVLVWLTDLPSIGESTYEGRVAEVSLRG